VGSIGEAACRLPDSVADVDATPEQDRPSALAALVRADVHDPAVAATAFGDTMPAAELVQLTDAVRKYLPVGAEAGADPRVRVFVSLLRAGALEPAWTLAGDNGAGTVAQEVGFSTWAGAARTSFELPLVPVIEGQRAYAWLPGFRDPRWQVPDDVYDITADIELRCTIDYASLRGDALLLAGTAQLTQLPSSQEEEATLLVGTSGRVLRVPGRRLRRPDLVKGTGKDLTRLAWSGWTVTIDLPTVLDGAGDRQCELEIVHRGLRRTALVTPVGAGPLGARSTVGPTEVGGCAVTLVVDPHNGIRIRSRSLPGRTRALPQPVRRAVRTLAGHL
jgi:hypothetical protein